MEPTQIGGQGLDYQFIQDQIPRLRQVAMRRQAAGDSSGGAPRGNGKTGGGGETPRIREAQVLHAQAGQKVQSQQARKDRKIKTARPQASRKILRARRTSRDLGQKLLLLGAGGKVLWVHKAP
ncbi:hypothetical protein HRG_008382 [Hirsutella rhossiliensis]|uniref:Uncharacterized protein n=1 Tax=Hirsutella rhossiliensis TaxID=111463 RepID=A0A9P8MRS6_9HYPO|nr:uncharacterized protein HRG_08382 [Hirsutella rhossiliensis]KAH0960227.1 hypothetical protein HRG_08382 [Hirsutella rhossiliensis]